MRWAQLSDPAAQLSRKSVSLLGSKNVFVDPRLSLDRLYPRLAVLRCASCLSIDSGEFAKVLRLCAQSSNFILSVHLWTRQAMLKTDFAHSVISAGVP